MSSSRGTNVGDISGQVLPERFHTITQNLVCQSETIYIFLISKKICDVDHLDLPSNNFLLKSEFRLILSNEKRYCRTNLKREEDIMVITNIKTSHKSAKVAVDVVSDLLSQI